MRKFVEDQLSKRTGKSSIPAPMDGGPAIQPMPAADQDDDNGEPCSSGSSKFTASLDDALFQKAAAKLIKYQSRKNEEMLSNEMLADIPEVDLGMNARIKNIVETEATKQRLLRDAIEKQKNIALDTRFKQDVVKDMAKDYVQHSKYAIDNTTRLGQDDWKSKRPRTEKVAVLGEGDEEGMDEPKLVEPKPSPEDDPDKPLNFRQKKFEYQLKGIAATTDPAKFKQRYWFPLC